MNFKTFLERYSGSDQEINIFYHGTPGKNDNPNKISPVAMSILSQGLIPFPKKRNWDADDQSGFNLPSRKSYGGVYVAKNLGTATGSALRGWKRGQSIVIVVMQLQSRSLLADEDDFLSFDTGFLNELSHESVLIDLFISIRTKEYQNYMEDVKNKYSSNMIEMLFKKSNPQPEFLSRVKYLVDNMFILAVERKMSYLKDRDFMYHNNYNEMVKKHGEERLKPFSVNQAEHNYAQGIDQLTKTMKHLARSQYDDHYNKTGRIMEPVGFTGTNKIITIIEHFHKAEEFGIEKDLTFIRYGKPPQQLIKDWEQQRGKWDAIYDTKSNS